MKQVLWQRREKGSKRERGKVKGTFLILRSQGRAHLLNNLLH